MAAFTVTNGTGFIFPRAATAGTQTVSVYGVTGTVADVSVTLSGLSHIWPDDLDFVLVAPDNNSNLVFMSDAGDSYRLLNATLTFADWGNRELPNNDQITSGIYRPANYDNAETGASFGIAGLGALNHAAPAGGATFASAFAGIAANGSWTLGLADDATDDGGSLARWSMSLTSTSDAVVLTGGNGADTATVSSTVAGRGLYVLNALKPVEFSGVSQVTFNGNGGNDTFTGGAGYDVANGGAGNDMLYGGAGNDLLYGGAGNDRLDGGAGADTMRGGAGNDTYIVDNAGDKVDETGGSGTDTVRASIGFSLAGTRGAVENLVLTGSAATAGSGNGLANVITGNGVANTLSGASGTDTLRGEGGSDRLYGGTGNDKLYGGKGNDRAYGGSGNDHVEGGAGVDRLYGDVGGDKLYGGEDGDYLYGGANNDRAYGGVGNDLVYGGTGADRLYGEAGNDQLYGGAGIDRLYGGAGNDRLYGGAGNDLIFGGGGTDRAYFSGPASRYDIRESGDTIIIKGPEGTDRLVGVEFAVFSDGAVAL